ETGDRDADRHRGAHVETEGADDRPRERGVEAGVDHRLDADDEVDDADDAADDPTRADRPPLIADPPLRAVHVVAGRLALNGLSFDGLMADGATHGSPPGSNVCRFGTTRAARDANAATRRPRFVFHPIGWREGRREDTKKAPDMSAITEPHRVSVANDYE